MRVETSYEGLREPLDPECERVQVLISRQIDSELDPASAEQLRGHLSECPMCRRMLELQGEQAVELQQNLKALWPQNDFQKKSASRQLAWMLTRLGVPCGMAVAAALAWAMLFENTAAAPVVVKDAEDSNKKSPVASAALSNGVLPAIGGTRPRAEIIEEVKATPPARDPFSPDVRP